MLKVAESNNSQKYITSIQLSVFSTEEIRQQSHVKIVENSIYEGKTAVDKGLRDVHLGPDKEDVPCVVCGEEKERCIGHCGNIELSRYLFPSGYLSDIIKILKCICKNCGCILLSEDDQKQCDKVVSRRMNYIEKKAKRKEIIEKTKKTRICRNCHSYNGMVKKMKSLEIIYHKKYTTKEGLNNHIKRLLDLRVADNVQNMLKDGIEFLRPSDVYRLFEMVPLKYYKYLGKPLEKGSRLSDLVYKYLPVTPNCIRPSTKEFNQDQSREDDITTTLRLMMVETPDSRRHLEYARLFRPSIQIWKDTTKISVGIKGRLCGKKGRFRQNLMGKRTNFTARTVISPDPYLQINQVGLPEYCALRLTFTEIVTESNIQHMKRLIMNGPHVHPGAIGYFTGNEVSRKMPMWNHRVMLPRSKFLKIFKPTWRENAVKRLKVGDIVERHIDNGDVVLFNRQPSLHRPSFQAYEVFVKKTKTLSFNPCCCAPFNADFDGDEMNIHFPQTFEAKAEAIELMSSIKNTTSPNSGEPLTAPLQDILTATYLLTSKDTFFTKNEFMKRAGQIFCNRDKRKRIIMPIPAILHPVELYTGKQFFSMIISMYEKQTEDGRTVPEVRINHITENRNCSEIEQNDLLPYDGVVHIHNSDLICGQLDKKLLGNGSKDTIFYRLLKDVSDEAACRSMERLCRIALYDIKERGFSIGITDVASGTKLQELHEKVIKTNFDACEKFIQQYDRGRLECDPGCTLEETLECRISSQLSDIRDKGGKECKKGLHKSNAALIMALCGSKGSLINISQMAFCVGQQIIDSKRICDVSGYNRTMVLCEQHSRNPMAHGFVGNSFNIGLNPVEFLFHAMSGREGLIDTAVKTSETGYMQRRMVKFIEDVFVPYGGGARDSAGNLLQIEYGADGFDPSKMETSKSPCDFWKELHHALQDGSDNRSDQPMEYLNNLLFCNNRHGCGDNRFPLLREELQQNLDKYLKSPRGSMFGITETQIKSFVRTCQLKHQRAIIEPGTPVGVLCSQSVGEPATQMTLKTFHFAGLASMNITRGVPRMTEILNAVPNIKTPIITVALMENQSPECARSVQRLIFPVILSDLIVRSQAVIANEGMFLYVYLDNRLLKEYDIDEKVLGRSIEKLAITKDVCDMSVVFKDDGMTHIEVVSQNAINCQTILGLLKTVQVLGVPSVKNAVTQQNSRTKEINVYVEGGRLKDVMSVPGVDGSRTLTNNILEAVAFFGIEAARQLIINEFRAVMDAHNLSPDIRHISLLADNMCHSGRVLGYQRSGMDKSKSDFLSLATFEKSLPHLFEAAYHHQRDSINGVSNSIIMGNTIPLGTGLHSILMNTNTKSKSSECNPRKRAWTSVFGDE